MSMTPSLPSTTTTTHPYSHHHHHHHHHHNDHDHHHSNVVVSAPSREQSAHLWTDPSSLPVNALDLWLEQATAPGPSSSNLNLNLDLVGAAIPASSNPPVTSTALSTPALTPNANATEQNSSFTMPVDQAAAALADMIADSANALPLDFTNNKPSRNTCAPNTNPHVAPIPSTPTLSATTNPLSSTPTPPAPLPLLTTVGNNITIGNNINNNVPQPNNAVTAENNIDVKNNMTKTSKTNASGRGKTTKPRGKAKSSKGEKSAQNNYSSTIATLSNSPMVSQSESLTPPNGNASNGSGAGPSSSFSGALTGASSSKVVETGETMDAVNALTTTGGSPSDGLSAVERAKRSAEQFTMSQLAKRRRKGLSPFPGSIGSPSSEEHTGLNGGPADEDGPEAESHRKYQKRLQKNRDSAFVSRIRRREYTRILESSLSAVEKEKDAAMAAFREMKRRFDVVSAELVGIKTAAASNFHTFVNPVMIPDMPPGVFIPPAEVGFHPGSYLSQKQQTYPGIVRDSHGNNIPPGSLTLPPSRPPPPSDGGGRSRPLMTTMYMVALVVGVLLPDFASRRTISTAVNKAITGVDTGGRIGVQPGVVVIAAATPAAEARDDQGGVAGRILSEKTGLDPSEVLTMGADLSQGAADRLVDAVRADAMTRLGEQVGERTLDAVRRHLRSLRTHEVATIEQYCREDGLHDGFEALLRAVLREDGDHAKEEDSLDDIAALVAGLNFEDRL